MRENGYKKCDGEVENNEKEWEESEIDERWEQVKRDEKTKYYKRECVLTYIIIFVLNFSRNIKNNILLFSKI